MECVETSVCDDAFTRVEDIVEWIRREDTFDQFVRERFALGPQFCHGNSVKHTVPPLEFDLSLNGSFFQECVLPYAWIESLQETLRKNELVSIDVTRQSDLFIPALIAIDLRSAEGRSFATLSSDTRSEKTTRQDDLIGRRSRIAADEDAHGVHTGPACEVLLRYSLATGLG